MHQAGGVARLREDPMRETHDRTHSMTPSTSASFQKAQNATGDVTRADLHVHSHASRGSAAKWLGALGVAECYSSPEAVYDLAKARGMDLVAITDHDEIDGALELVDRGFDGVIVGEEITTRFADTRCILHVLVWGVTPAIHDEISGFRLREDAVALAHWLRDRDLAHALAHPLFDINGKLTAAELNRCLSLFGGFESINAGHTTAHHRQGLASALERFDSGDARHSHERLWPRRWFTGGSDDHALTNIGKAWTAVSGRQDAVSFLRAIVRGESQAGGVLATSDALACQFIGVAQEFVTREAGPMTRRVKRVRRTVKACIPDPRTVNEHTGELNGVESLRHASTKGVARQRARFGEHEADLSLPFSIRALIDLAAPIALPQTAHIVAFVQHQKERALLNQLSNRRITNKRAGTRLALFVDSLDHMSGVSRFVRDLIREAEDRDKQLRVFTCASQSDDWPSSVDVSDPIGRLSIPMYQDLEPAIPWAPDVLDACAEWAPDVIHVSTPGPMGLIGAIAAHALHVPLAGTHHTDFPAYAAKLAKQERASALVSQALAGLYGRFDRVLARSEAYAEHIEDLDVGPSRIRVITPGIDLSKFGSSRRDDSTWTKHSGVHRSSVKALYVGRISAEKNLALLSRVWREAHTRLEQLGIPAELIVVGDGPYRIEMARELTGHRTRFLGRQSGEELAAIYASCDFFMFPSITDTLGQVVMEAQASGLPAIVSDQGGPSSLIEHGKTGLIVSPDDVSNWVRSAVLLAADTNQRRRMSRAALAHARQFSFERSFHSFWSIHEELVTGSTETSTPSIETPFMERANGAPFIRPAATASS